MSNILLLRGTSGVSPASASQGAANPGMYTSGGACGAGYSWFAPGSRVVYQLNLGPDVPLGGLLTLTTCGLTSNNTALYLGLGCPTWSGAFNCLRGNDNAADVAGQTCGPNPLASTLSHVAASRIYLVQLGDASGSGLVSGLRWNYTLPTLSATPSRSSSRSRSRSAAATPTRTRSATATKSRSRKAK